MTIEADVPGLSDIDTETRRTKILLDISNAAQAEVARLRLACVRMNDEISQELGKALGCPWFYHDQKNFPGSTEKDGVCVGDEVAESLAVGAARRIRWLESQLSLALGTIERMTVEPLHNPTDGLSGL